MICHFGNERQSLFIPSASPRSQALLTSFPGSVHLVPRLCLGMTSTRLRLSYLINHNVVGVLASYSERAEMPIVQENAFVCVLKKCEAPPQCMHSQAEPGNERKTVLGEQCLLIVLIILQFYANILKVYKYIKN
ncbi:hypothetical protein NUACC26_089590 [Scytonema sp. NUACC26]